MAEHISIELSDLDLPTVKLRFDRIHDRWAHCWSSIDQGREHPWMQSVEGTPDQDWPPSPPLQELNQLALGSGDSVLGVGMAGRSHWSASYSIEHTSDGASFIKSDLACLQKEAASDPITLSSPQLGSTYEFAADCVIETATESRIEIATPTTNRIILEAIEIENRATVFQLNERNLTVLPSQISQSPVRASRWAFRVKVAG